MSDMLGKEVREVKDELVAFKTSTLTELANFKLDIAKELRSTKWQTLGLMVGLTAIFVTIILVFK
ncbi:hypothetical protein B0S90_2839 [Caldicellulosiruptor bescii]|uniref:Uncharacterized protein n=2 Tax=Caldicellulosiruptor bescii TaxID=31899 RepID=B9MP04_CALBD|nr:hypothetical protein [Caldicellulosiruptor bescii]ACM61563.1 hypothetical protein Athe_2495 [Caldicellulosiruptor bescii DSM 6725]PBC88624.1 hypothetical protein B0S87_1652 [Caldicellulosiruptor bescii]PBC91895.1 hypothetical protein B0S89_2341 [Caldicellulosiruptor bescii]PBD02694.1 hypothetical protein B0S85_0233 [Caldicellulosiruptor bescii]PBD07689.1 hypothetical protein B0S90_2839 [Caldicellulosiruptor bescii]